MMMHTVRERAGAQAVEPDAVAALLVPLVGGMAADQGRATAIARGLLEPLVGRFAARVADPLDVAEAPSHVTEWLSQATRLLLLPFGRRAAGTLPLLIEDLECALAEHSGEHVIRNVLPAPSGAVVRPIFAPLEGVACAQTQLTPLLRHFPGWSPRYLGLSAGSLRLVLYCDQVGGDQRDPIEANPLLLDLLEMGLGWRAGRWKDDGEIFVSYIQSLVGGVLRGPVCAVQDTLSSTSLHLLTPPWLRPGAQVVASGYKTVL
jgi:hypothetical protein